MRHRLSELRFNVFKNILQSLGQTEQQAEKLSSEALQIFMNGRHQLTLFDGVEEVLAQLKENILWVFLLTAMQTSRGSA